MDGEGSGRQKSGIRDHAPITADPVAVGVAEVPAEPGPAHAAARDQ
jgi:hypothetical protein